LPRMSASFEIERQLFIDVRSGGLPGGAIAAYAAAVAQLDVLTSFASWLPIADTPGRNSAPPVSF